MKNYHDSGLKAPDIVLINETCKLKQAIRSAFSVHDIAFLQKAKFDLKQLVPEVIQKMNSCAQPYKPSTELGQKWLKNLIDTLQTCLYIKVIWTT